MSLATDINGLRDWLVEIDLVGAKPGELQDVAANLKEMGRRAAALELAAVPLEARHPVPAAGAAPVRLVHGAEVVPQGGAA